MKKVFFSILLVLTCAIPLFSSASIRGDVNDDGVVNPADISALIDYLLNGSGAVSVVNADTNNDGSVNSADISMLIDYLLGSVPTLDGENFTVNGVSFTMIPVEGGTFTMGATEEQGSDASSIEKPTHQVTLSSYSIGQTEVTQALWEAVMGESQSAICSRLGESAYGIGADNPVFYVSWEDCHLFIAELNRLTGKNFRLPTEAEWEFAARGGNKSQGYTYSGSNDINEVAWYWDNIPSQNYEEAGYGTQPVATKAPNELGLYDMSGNVWEWCQDWYDWYSSEHQTNPTGPETGFDRMGRGGSWYRSARYCRVSNRGISTPSNRSHDLGLRLAL